MSRHRGARPRLWTRWVAVVAGALLALAAVAGVAYGALRVAFPSPARTTAVATPVARPPAAPSATPVTPSSSATAASSPALEPAGSVIAIPGSTASLPVLMYHHVLPRAINSLAITVGDFDAQMGWLKSAGYHPVNCRDLADVRAGRVKLPAKPVMLTFDDGRTKQITYAVPILRKYGFTAVFFVYPSAMADTPRTFMSKGQLRQLTDQGFDVESHTLRHTPMYRSRTENEPNYMKRMKPELAKARTDIETMTGKAPVALAYPMGYYDKWSAEALRTYGYQFAFTVDGGANPLGSIPAYFMRRIAVDRGLTLGTFKHEVQEPGLVFTPLVPAYGQLMTSIPTVSVSLPASEVAGSVQLYLGSRRLKATKTRKGDIVIVSAPAGFLPQRDFASASITAETLRGSLSSVWSFPLKHQ